MEANDSAFARRADVKWTVSPFWLVLAVLYLVLARASFQAGQHYDRQLAMVAQGFSVEATRPPRPVELGAEERDAKGNIVVADLLPDWRGYLRVSTRVNTAGRAWAQ